MEWLSLNKPAYYEMVGKYAQTRWNRAKNAQIKQDAINYPHSL